jgi:hypothetical protein
MFPAPIPRESLSGSPIRFHGLRVGNRRRLRLTPVPKRTGAAIRASWLIIATDAGGYLPAVARRILKDTEGFRLGSNDSADLWIVARSMCLYCITALWRIAARKLHAPCGFCGFRSWKPFPDPAIVSDSARLRHYAKGASRRSQLDDIGLHSPSWASRKESFL